MSQYQGRRRANSSRRWPILIAAVAATATAAALGWVVVDKGPSAESNEDQPTSSDTSCPDAATIAAPLAYLDAWNEVAAAWKADCSPVNFVVGSSPAVVEGKVTNLSGWIPEDVSTATLAAKTLKPVGKPVVVASSPIVLAMDAGRADALGGIGSVASTKVLGNLVRTTRQLPATADEPAADLAIVMPDPGASVTGALAFAGLAASATGKAIDGAPSYVNPSKVDITEIKTEHRIVATVSDDAAVFDEVESLTPPNAYLTSESVVWRHNAADPTLAATSLPGGSPRLRMPLVTLDPAAATTLADFATFLTSEEGASALTKAGLRPADGSAAPAADDATSIVTADYPTNAPEMSANTAAQIGMLFGYMHQRISTMVAVDASGSMLFTLEGSDVSKVALLRRAARDAMSVASPAARSGLLVFRSNAKDKPLITRPVDLLPNGSMDGDLSHSDAMIEALNSMTVSGGTPLYNGVLAAYRYAVNNYDPEMVNQLVLLSDGENRDAIGSITYDRLIADLKAMADPERPVRIVAIGIGQDADMPALEGITAATGGRSTWLRTYDGYADAMTEALFTA